MTSGETPSGTMHVDSKAVDASARMPTDALRSRAPTSCSMPWTNCRSSSRTQAAASGIGIQRRRRNFASPQCSSTSVTRIGYTSTRQRAVAVHMSIATERLPRDHAAEAGFLLGFADRRVARSLTFIDPALGDNPTLPAAGRHQRDLDDDPCGSDRESPLPFGLRAPPVPPVASEVRSMRSTLSALPTATRRSSVPVAAPDRPAPVRHADPHVEPHRRAA